MITKIFTGADKAHELGYADLRAMLLALLRKRGLAWNGKISKKPVPARIDFGRWIADCPDCGGACYVDPADPSSFFCMGCGNASVGGAMRLVEFPADRELIELEVLRRPVAEPARMGPVDTALNSKPMVPGLSRSWRPGETVQDLADQMKAALKAAEA